MVISKNMEFQSGFTLMEMMIVIAVIGIMASIAIPNIIGWLPDYRLRSSTRDVVSCLQEAKMRAVKENSRVVVIFDQVAEAYTTFIVNVDAGGNSVFDGTETIVRQETMLPGIDVQTTSAPFEFNSRGLSTSVVENRVQIQNTKPNFSRITMNLAGGIRVEMSSDGITWN